MVMESSYHIIKQQCNHRVPGPSSGTTRLASIDQRTRPTQEETHQKNYPRLLKPQAPRDVGLLARTFTSKHSREEKRRKGDERDVGE